MNVSNSEGTSRVRRRDRLRSFAQSTTLIIKQEISKYYISPSSSSSSSTSTSTTSTRGVMATTATAAAAADTAAPVTTTTTTATVTTTTTATVPIGPHSTDIKRSETQEIDAIIEDDIPEVVQPQCMLFPTYASQVEDDSLKEVEWKVVLGGWAFAKPSSSRLNRWLLAAGRTYGGLAANSVEYNQFSTLFNQFRSTTMTMTDVQLSLPGIIAKKIIENNQDNLNENQQEKIRDLSALLVNSGPSGRFEKEILLDTESIKQLKEHSKYLTVEASFKQDEAPFPGFVDIIDPYGISIISDIDDTIKITDVPDGRDAILQNTFFRAAREVPGMSEVYRNWSSEGAHIHYVSNGPWQVYPVLNEFFEKEQFPQGSMHLRQISAQELIIGKPGKHKLEVIPKIFQDFPHRKFILVGDTGEIDPEIYQQIYNQFPDQVIKIFIHDVTSQRAMTADKQAQNKSDSYYTSLRKFISRESTLLRSGSTSQLVAMDAMTVTEVPDEQKNISDPEVPLKTKLEQFEERMKRVSAGMREGVFTVYTLASQLLLDPVAAEEFLMSKSATTHELMPVSTATTEELVPVSSS